MFKSKFKKVVIASILSLGITGGIAGNITTASAESYTLDTKGAHASIQFKISHLGYSWVLARFNKFEGQMEFDASKPEASSVNITVDTASLDSNHAERDKHLRSDDFFDVSKFPTATFVSTGLKSTGEKTATLSGDLTIKGVTKPITMDVNWIGGGDDPWGNVRQGFEGSTVIPVADYGMLNMGPAAQEVEILVFFEGVRKK
ncbi:YceI family protein [Kiloniella antarctica]|uniref:YceI family protein n=1 Tax=Kiloniella antarctica TaxID=1550907 RepID=A0ABW5BLU3_9PROT